MPVKFITYVLFCFGLSMAWGVSAAPTDTPVKTVPLPVDIKRLAGDFPQITDLQAVPGDPQLIAVLLKTGQMYWYDMAQAKRGLWLELKVITASEQGLLGLAFHPQFSQNGRFVLHYSSRNAAGANIGRVEIWQFETAKALIAQQPRALKVVLEVEQPYGNHKAGQLAFGPDGYLYIGWGDGGAGGDPHGHGQNPLTWLGSLLRVNIDQSAAGKNYTIPPDNPFVGKKDFLPETWAFGFRNPWRYSFDQRGRLVVADVGQDAWEEISVVERGKNYGWNVREGRHCFKPRRGCAAAGFTDPIFEYGRDQGQSITGGYVYLGQAMPALKGKYIFGDFVAGRVWAIDLPKNADIAVTQVYVLGQFPLMISTFGRTATGEILLSSFGEGEIYQLVPVGDKPRPTKSAPR